MSSIFPSEIINASVESHFSKFSKKSQLLYIVIILLFVGSVISTFLIKIDITIQSRGILRSIHESVSIISPVIAEVVRTNIYENKYVLKGDTLIWLDCQKFNKRIDYLNELILKNKSYINDIFSMLNYNYSKIETNLFNTSHAQYRQKLCEFDLTIQSLQRSLRRTEILYNEEVISAIELEGRQFELEKIIEEKKSFVKYSRNEWQGQSVKFRNETEQFYSEIESLKNDLKSYFILAPEAGHVANFIGAKQGSFISAGQPIAIISPNEAILVETLVSPQDIGYLRINMPVIVQIDAYNYNQWGFATGNITEISKEIYLVNSQPFFKVRSNLNQSFLSLGNGYRGYLIKGLTTTARYRVSERSLAQLIFDKTDDWLNPKLFSEQNTHPNK